MFSKLKFRRAGPLLLAVVAASTSFPASAAFTGPYAPANWTPFTQVFVCGTSEVVLTGMPNSLVLRTITGCANIGAGYSLTANIPASGTLSFDWTYSSASAQPPLARYFLGGVGTTLATGNVVSAGTVSIPVVAGQTFSLNLDGSTDATFTITNFNGPLPVAVPTPVPTLDEWARIALAGLLALTAFAVLRRHRR